MPRSASCAGRRHYEEHRRPLGGQSGRCRPTTRQQTLDALRRQGGPGDGRAGQQRRDVRLADPARRHGGVPALHHPPRRAHRRDADHAACGSWATPDSEDPGLRCMGERTRTGWARQRLTESHSGRPARSQWGDLCPAARLPEPDVEGGGCTAGSVGMRAPARRVPGSPRHPPWWRCSEQPRHTPRPTGGLVRRVPSSAASGRETVIPRRRSSGASSMSSKRVYGFRSGNLS